jgi:site-specific recombinase XerC
MNHTELFDHYLRHRESIGDRLSPTSESKYGAIWSAWGQFLAGKDLLWQDATPALLEEFIAAIAPRNRRLPQSSNVSHNRYWRAIQAVYEHSEFALLCRGSEYRNPLRGARTPESARSDAAASCVLTPQQWDALRLVAPVARDWTALRDRAMLSLVLDTALTVAELRALSIHDLVGSQGAPVNGDQPEQQVSKIKVAGSREAQARELTLSPSTTATLGQWLRARAALGPVEPGVFLSRKGLKRPSAMAIWHNLGTLIQQALHLASGPQALHWGPNVLRNAVIMRWLTSGAHPMKVAERAGLSSVRKLDRIAVHCDLQTRQRVAAN